MYGLNSGGLLAFADYPPRSSLHPACEFLRTGRKVVLSLVGDLRLAFGKAEAYASESVDLVELALL